MNRHAFSAAGCDLMNDDLMRSAPQSAEAPELPGERWGGGWRLGAGAALMVVLAFAVYWPALRGQFVWDDAMLVQQNPLVKGKLGLSTIWFRTDFPLTIIAFWAQWRLWGDNPAGYHIVSVLCTLPTRCCCGVCWRA